MRSTNKVRLAVVVAAACASAGLSSGAASADPAGFIPDEFEYGFFYGTFDEAPNTALFAGGTFEEFCTSDPDGGPGTVPLRVFPRPDGTTDLKVNAKDQPIYLYETEFNDINEWLGSACEGIVIDGDAPPKPFASGEADLKVRITVVSEDRAEIFNSVNGKATGTNGTEYKVRGSADLIVDGGIPVGDPRDFVDFTLREIRR
jgi:hypothetical protein